MLVVGDAGVGKTALAEEAMALGAAAGATTRRVTCWAEAGAPPLWPWSELLRSAGAPAVDAAPADRDPELARFTQFSAFVASLHAATAHAPLLLVIDDLHWADAASVRLLAFAAPRLRDIPVFVLATYRGAEVEGPSDLAAQLPELVRHGRQLAITPIAREDYAKLVEQMAAAEVSSALLDRLYTLTAGNALYTRELVSLLDVLADDGDLPVPESVRATLTKRIESVSRPAQEALAVASTVGVDFAIDVISEAAQVNDGDIRRSMDEAEHAGLVRANSHGRFSFTHPLIRETAYRGLRFERRMRLHEAVGDALERLRDRGAAVDTTALAHHFHLAAAAAPATAVKAVSYARAAARDAMQVLAYESAAMHLDNALAVLDLGAPDAERRTDVLLELGDARVATGDLPGARGAFEEAARLAHEHGWPQRLATAALGLGSGASGFEIAPFDAAHIGWLRAALAVVDDDASRAWLLARLSVALSIDGSASERRRLADDAVALGRRCGDDAALAYALAAHCDVIALPEFCGQRLAEASEIVELARACGDVHVELLGRRLRVLALAESGRFGEFDAEVDAYERVSEAIRRPLYSWYVPLWRAMRAEMLGRFDEAAALCADAEQLGMRTHSANAMMLTKAFELVWLFHTGLVERAYEETFRLIDDWSEIAFMARPGTAMVAARFGRTDEARSLLDRIDLTDRDLYGAEWLPAAAMAAEAVALVGGHALGPQLYDALVPFRHLFAIDGIAAANWGSIELPLGMLAAVLGRTNDARAHFDAAIERHRQVGAVPLLHDAMCDRETALGARASTAARAGVFRRDGDVWTVSYDGREVRLRHTKGMADLARLLEHPGREIHALDLTDARVKAAGTGPVIDERARVAYKERLRELEREIDDADRAADAARSDRLDAERTAILAELSTAYGIGGRARRVGDAGERARSAVTQRIRDTLNRIEAEHPSLGQHLRRAVRTGTYCAYEPDGPFVWEVVSHA